MPETTNTVLLPSLPYAEPLREATLFGFDDRAFPFRDRVQARLIPGVNPQVVLRGGPPGSPDEVLLYYGTVTWIGDTLHMWYNGNHGPEANNIGYERVTCCICYATSRDGVTWDKPNLGLVELDGSKENNVCALDAPTLWSTCALLHEPEAPDPNRRYKLAYEARYDGRNMFCVAFSPDGLRWTPSARNPVGPFIEMSGIAKFRGLYYVNGQPRFDSHGQALVRRLATFVSADFEHWSPCAALGLDRSGDRTGPSTDADLHAFEEIHLGAALWNRGNVLLGIYGMWHGHPSGERRMVTMDLGLALSHDAIHFYEPIRDFKFIPAREQPESPLGVGPSLMQGQGMENVGDRTLYWYSLWRGTPGSGVRMVSWERDRLGFLQPFHSQNPRSISCPIQITADAAKVTVNVSGLGQHTQLRIDLVDEGFRPIPGCSCADAALVTENGFAVPVCWRSAASLSPEHGRVRLDVQFVGVRPEDARLYAVYVGVG
jgi:hypothetical protein